MAARNQSNGSDRSAAGSFSEVHDIVLKAVRAGRNVLIEGPYGAGKTALVRSVATASNLELKYFSASTLDPFADLVGIPVPLLNGESRHIVFLRPDAVNTAELFFFDELNRAHPKVLNAVFELIQFRSVNGEPLPRLRSIVAAVNPGGAGYQVQDLDPALVDRFQIYVSFDDGPDRNWFIQEFGSSIGTAVLDWYFADLDRSQRTLVSNRRLEYIGRALQDGIDVQFALPVGSHLPLESLLARVNADCGLPTIEDFVREPARFASSIAADIRLATRFAQLWPMMKPTQKCRVKDLILELHSEALAAANADTPFVIKKSIQAIAQLESKAEATAFGDLLDQRLAQIQSFPKIAHAKSANSR